MGHVDHHAICRFVYTGPRVGPDTFLRNFRGTIVADAFKGCKHVDQKTVISSAARHTLDVSA